MAIDVSELLLDDADTAPSSDVSGEQPKRGRGRPKGSTSASRKGGASVPRAAGAKELAQLLAKVIGGASILIALVLQADEAAMTPQEANDIARPAARLLAKSSLAARMAHLAGKGSDWIDLTLAVATYGLRLYPLIVLRQQQIELQRQQQKGYPVGQPHPEDARVWQSQPAQAAAPAAQPASNGQSGTNGHDAARVAADAAAFGGLGFADADALAAGVYGNVAANIRAAKPEH